MATPFPIDPIAPVGVQAALAGYPPKRTALAQFSLQGQVALVTGALRGIGLELALALAEAGATVYCVDLPAAPDKDWLAVQAYCASLPPIPDVSSQASLIYLQGDVTNQQGMWALAEDIVKKSERLDICVANAGIADSAFCLDYDDESFSKVLDVNTKGAFFTAQAAGRQMTKWGRGSIIMTASISGSVANRGLTISAYNTSKAAVLQLSRSMAMELAPKGIRVNTLSPGYVITPMTQATLDNDPTLEEQWASQNFLGRMGNTSELRGVIIWLASSASSFCTGSDIIVDGGHRAW